MGRFVKYFELADGHNSIAIPGGSTAEAPANPDGGAIRFNTSINKLEYYNGTAWVALTGGVGGAGTITIDTYTILNADNEDSTTYNTTPRDWYGPLSLTPSDEKNVLVFLGGVYQPYTAYTINSDSTTINPYIQMLSLVTGDVGSSLVVIHGFDAV